MNASFDRRLRQQRSRVLVRSWGYRQRRHARGVWFRFRRALAEASEAYAVTRAEAENLVAEGHEPAPVGADLEPPKLLLFIPASRVAGLASARPLALRMSAELLAAECLALVPFDHETTS